MQDDVQHDCADVRRQPHLGPARHHRPEIPRPPAAGRLRDVRVSVSTLTETCQNPEGASIYVVRTEKGGVSKACQNVWKNNTLALACKVSVLSKEN